MAASVRHTAARRPDGTLVLVSTPVPPTEPGTVRIAVHASLVSPGTEVGGWFELAGKYRAAAGTSQAGEASAFGYSVAGVVDEIGDGVADRFRPGDRVAAIGAGYALHAETVVVPHHLCVVVPDEVPEADACYAMLLATGLHAARRGTPAIGENWLVTGLGLVGLLTARFLQIAGCFVSGIDTSPERVAFAERWLGGSRAAVVGPARACTTPAEAETVLPVRTRAMGFDGAVLAFGGAAQDAVNQTVRLLKRSPDGHPYGTIVAVGWPRFDYSDEIGGMNNVDLRRASRTGPGYHDELWERGNDYPPVFMRWTTRANLELCMELLRLGRIDVHALTTHTIRLLDVERELPRILERPAGVLGVVFTMDNER